MHWLLLWVIVTLHLEVITVMKTKKFQKILSNNNAVLELVILNDHHALGIIDIFAKTLKACIIKGFSRK
jgi:hypothetical protein